MTNAVEVLCTLPAQVMMFDRMSEDFGESWKTALFLKEKRERIRLFGDQPNISMRAGIYRVENVALPSFPGVGIVNVLVSINNVSYYELFLNYCADDRLNVFEDLSTQTDIDVIILDEDMNVVRMLKAKNQIRHLIIGFSALYSERDAWTDDHFDTAKAALLEELPDLMKL